MVGCRACRFAILVVAIVLFWSGSSAWSQTAFVKPNSIAFGKVQLYARSDRPKVKNVITIGNAAKSGPAVTINLPTNLPPGVSMKALLGAQYQTKFNFGPLASVPIEVDFSPTKDGKFSTQLVFTTTDPKHPAIKIHVTAHGIGKPPDVTANPPNAIFLGDADGAENVYTDSSGHVGDAAIGPGVASNSLHYGGVSIPLNGTLPGHSPCDASYTDDPTNFFALSGAVVAGGGTYSNGTFTSFTSDVEAYDPCTKSFSTVGQLPTPVAWPTLTRFDGGYALVGGIESNGAPSRQVTLIWQDPNSGAIGILPGPLLSTGRLYAYAAGQGQMANGFPDPAEFIVAGGIDSSGHVNDTFQIVCAGGIHGPPCDPTDIGGTGKLMAPRAGATGIEYGFGISLMGGVDDSGSASSSTEIIAAITDPFTGIATFTSVAGPPLSAPRAFASSVSLQPGLPFLIGGLSGATFSTSYYSVIPVGPPLASTETFDCSGFVPGPPLNTARAFAGVAYSLITASVLTVAGGIGADGQPVNTIEMQPNAFTPIDGGANCSPLVEDPFQLLPGTTSVGHPAPLSITP